MNYESLLEDYGLNGINCLCYRRRLNVRYEQKVKHFESFIYLAMIDLIFTKLGPLEIATLGTYCSLIVGVTLCFFFEKAINGSWKHIRLWVHIETYEYGFT